jgi:hypothetical protein
MSTREPISADLAARALVLAWRATGEDRDVDLADAYARGVGLAAGAVAVRALRAVRPDWPIRALAVLCGLRDAKPVSQMHSVVDSLSRLDPTFDFEAAVSAVEVQLLRLEARR